MSNNSQGKLSGLLRDLRFLIASLPPGAALPKQGEICKRFGVTTYVLNQAVRELEREGLVKPVSGHGVFVRDRTSPERRFLQVVFLDNPEIVRFREFGLHGILKACAKKNIECRISHIRYDDNHALRAQLMPGSETSVNGTECCGAIVSGYVQPSTVRFLDKQPHLWVIFGDVFAREPMVESTIVCGDSFQGGKLGLEVLHQRGCRRILLVNYALRDKWCWTVEGRAGVLDAAGNLPDTDVFLPKHDCIAEPREFEKEAREWAAGVKEGPAGVLCSGHHSFHMASVVRYFLAENIEPVFCVVDADETRLNSPGVLEVLCSMEACAEAAVDRLLEMRHGRKTHGRQCISAYTLVT